MKRKQPELKENGEQEVGEVIPFEVIDGGRLALDFKEPPTSDWLSPLPIGTLFNAGDKHSADYVLQQFEVVDKTNKSVVLEHTMGQKITFPVDPPRFCQKYFLHEIIGEFVEND